MVLREIEDWLVSLKAGKRTELSSHVLANIAR